MKNGTWRDIILQKSDLPLKAQKFIDLLGITVDTVEILYLEADPNGKYFKEYSNNPRVSYDWENRIIYLVNNMKVSTIIHELMHVYIRDNNIDTQVIAYAYMEETSYTWSAISRYGLNSFCSEQYEETVCEIVARYGRRGQFDKIAQLFGK